MHTLQYYLAIKNDQIFIYTKTCMKQETVTKDHFLYDFNYLKCPEEGNLQTVSSLVVTWDWVIIVKGYCV